MIVTAAVLLASAPPDCGDSAAARSSECALARSLDQVADADCVERMTQRDLNVCSYRDYLRADIALNDTWSQIAQRFRPPAGDAASWQSILDAQRAWIAFRDAECGVWRRLYEGGSIVPLMAHSCLASVTEQRTKQLQTLLEMP